MLRIGEHAISRGKLRLREHLDRDQGEDNVRSGKLLSSIGTVFEVSDEQVTAGTNVHYANQYQFGGTIVPSEMKALAIPLLPQLKRHGLSPRDLDPERKLLQLIPGKGGKPAVLVNPERTLTGRQTKKRGTLAKIKGIPEFPPGPLFVLVRSVTQKPHPFLFWDDEDQRTIREELIPAWLAGN
jgi:hypothetical protein